MRATEKEMSVWSIEMSANLVQRQQRNVQKKNVLRAVARKNKD